MADGRPILGDVELQLVQKIETDEDEVLTQHGVPALEGDFLQRQRRRATQIKLSGILTGPEAGEGLKTLRNKFRAAEPVPFVADIAAAVRVDQMLIEEMGVRELAGKPERFEYAFILREYFEETAVSSEQPFAPSNVTNSIDEEVASEATDGQDATTTQIDKRQGTLEVVVETSDAEHTDFTQFQIHVEGQTEAGEPIDIILIEQEGGVYRRIDVPAGNYTVSLQMVG